MTTNELHKGDRVLLRNGWYATQDQVREMNAAIFGED